MKFSYLGPKPSPWLFSDLLLLPCGWDIIICVHHLQRVDFLWKCTIRFRHDSETIPTRFRNDSVTNPTRSRKDSDMIPTRFRHDSDTIRTGFRHKEKRCLRRRPSMNRQLIRIIKYLSESLFCQRLWNMWCLASTLACTIVIRKSCMTSHRVAKSFINLGKQRITS